ncbi:Putative flippase GtrA (transmembrane translocase of bactoprenol-linked glucose) [Geodermatophilus dictyosporus]|uniref:Putative flippase GtrA (Transmembrane translocase of bactoprenol-linked glucose) n=1 Tax=Geodermatophilus dictyosporus TaxID=1523247 RepID=A0A1I5LCT6_9ACTN|nr:GtrA family protein [Geodermatophilus dictyosporus]SFO94531.1 Putative flippase GtrA (transmembrane translocase of bactoprenol-linked glucose) [Geodermatophilus dictyosporus]
MPSLPALRRRVGGTWRVLLKEIGAFGVVGAASFVLDVGVFQLLYTRGVEAVAAKLVSSLLATTAAYAGHRFWSFAHRERSGYGREYAVFATVNGATLLLSLSVVALVRHPLGQQDALVLQAANVAAIALGTVVRWFAYRRWVFRAGSRETVPVAGTPRTGRSRGFEQVGSEV